MTIEKARNLAKRFFIKIMDNIENTSTNIPDILKKGTFMLKNLKYLNKIIKKKIC